ncbi:hypothetical protein [Paludisphaera rhizosphaerae]|nr:hypothetical protein [Paludisphaera rhizosphaerae]
MPDIPTAADVRDWAVELQAIERLIAHRFPRQEPQERAAAYL